MPRSSHPTLSTLAALARDPAGLSATLTDRAVPSLGRDDAEATLAELVYRACECPSGGLLTFAEHAWPTLNPKTPFETNWHIEAICEHLEAVTAGAIRNLVINIPPRHLKSSLVAVLWPIWDWGPANHPDRRVIFSSYAQALSGRDSRYRRRVIASPWYQRGWSNRFSLGRAAFTADGQVKYENDQTGYHLATSVKGSNTGEGGDILVADDAHNLKEIHSDTMRHSVLTWWDEVMSTRLNDPRTGAKVIIMQRGHERDLAGHVLETGGYVHLNLPTEFDPGRRCVVFLGGVDGDHSRPGPDDDPADPFFADPRTAPRELLFPRRFGPEQVAQAKRDLKAYGFAAQHQQDPAPAGGGIVHAAWWRFWVPADSHLLGLLDTDTSSQIALWRRDPVTNEPGPGHPLVPYPAAPRRRIQSWDCAFKDAETHSYVVGQHWAQAGTSAYLGAQVREHLSFTATVNAILDFTTGIQRLPHLRRSDAVYIEDKANGPAVIDALRHRIPGVRPCLPQGSKESRVHAVSDLIAAGNVLLPHPSLAPWVDGFIHEFATFPAATYDDQVDAATQAIAILLVGQVFGAGNFAVAR